MLRIYRNVEDGQVVQSAEICGKSWLSLINPTEEEIQMVSEKTGIIRDFLRDPLDNEERPRIEVETGQILIIIKVPVARPEQGVNVEVK